MTSASAPALGPRRPRGVTIIGVVAYIGGVVDVVGGSMLLVLATGAALLANPLPGGLVTAISVIAAGVVVVGVADGLMRGSRLARWFVTVARGVSVVLQFVALTTGGVALIVGIVSLVISVIVLSWLWMPSARAYFARPGNIPPGV
ncbi:MAG: hypothetical protein B7Y93_01160 [Micrococcales bacterium 32-70-13]|nr:MAG: hypothetical protein B7Y93_01160 [Micrococcales bacterium 32-70-13]